MTILHCQLVSLLGEVVHGSVVDLNLLPLGSALIVSGSHCCLLTDAGG